MSSSSNNQCSSKEIIAIIGATNEISIGIINKLDPDKYSLCLGYFKSESKANLLCESLNKKGFDNIKIKINCLSPNSIKNYIDSIINLYGSIDHLIILSGISEKKGSAIDADFIKIHEIIQVNLTSAIYASIYFSSIVKNIPKKKMRTITFISSEAGTYGGDGIPIYAASKGGLNSFVKGLARELGEMSIRVNAISPGIIISGEHYNLNDDLKKEYSQKIPLGRLGEPNDIGNLISWLISEAANYISGAIIPVAGGR